MYQNSFLAIAQREEELRCEKFLKEMNKVIPYRVEEAIFGDKRNKKLSSIRAKVDYPFQVLKCQWGYCKVRYKGLKKNTLQLYTLFSLINLFKARKVLLAMGS